MAFHIDQDRALLEELARVAPGVAPGGMLPAVFSLKSFHVDWRDFITQPGEPSQLYALRPAPMLDRVDQLRRGLE